MRRAVLSALVLSVAALSACGRASTNVADYVGEYVYTPLQTPPDEEADIVILRADGIALLIWKSADSPGIGTKEKRWKLTVQQPEGQPDIVIGDHGYPVEVSGKVIRLALNYDLDLYYEKVR